MAGTKGTVTLSGTSTSERTDKYANLKAAPNRILINMKRIHDTVSRTFKCNSSAAYTEMHEPEQHSEQSQLDDRKATQSKLPRQEMGQL